MAGGDGGLDRVRPERLHQRLGAGERGQTAPDEQVVPPGADLIGEQDGLAVPGRRAPARARNAAPSAQRARAPRVRIGLTVYHISNARLYDRNPGVNALAFVQTF